jgi:hypothetical protein
MRTGSRQTSAETIKLVVLLATIHPSYVEKSPSAKLGKCGN